MEDMVNPWGTSGGLSKELTYKRTYCSRRKEDLHVNGTSVVTRESFERAKAC